MIWNYIRDFFVQYIFGGYASNETAYSGWIGHLMFASDENFNFEYEFTDSLYFKIGDAYGDMYGGYPVSSYISIGDWLSTTATIICMVLISICFILLIRWIFKAVASAFLLK